MLDSLIALILCGFLGGQIAQRLRVPALVGMVLVGIALGPQGLQVLRPELLAGASDVRVIAVMVILMKAGLGLDREKLKQQGTVALRLGFLPALGEMVVVAIAAAALLTFDWQRGLLLGCVLGAESPAVIVPGMLRLKSLGWGVDKGIPDAILTGSALSDVLLLLLFNLLMGWLTAQTETASLWWWPVQVLAQVGLGVALGWLMAQVLVWLFVRQNWTQNAVQEGLLTAALALSLVVGAERLPWYSGYLAVMATGFFLIEVDAPLARRLRGSFDGLWVGAELFLFVLLGASIPLAVLGTIWRDGLLILALGTLVGRGLGWWLSTWGSNWNPRERLFLLAGNSAKATVQAAIGALPLAAGIPGGEQILALAALSILVTAPLGAWAIPTFAPRLLSRGPVDPTKVSVGQPVVVLAAVDVSPLAVAVLTKAAELARRSDGRVVVLHVVQVADPAGITWLRQQTNRLLADIRHELLCVEGAVVETILRTAATVGATEIVMGKRGQRPELLMGSVSQAVLESSPLPVVVVEESR
ncbi:MAG: cation:proton antiporter [Gloeomargarita sp. SKYBB_i_bin120]|nr:cation:proton antiporter [Gloeomargarita sp. SKYG98]MCS7292638.1 cation:proton antiporter [Gloeomargarita sp. SKYB120]MDW8178200.1 cation:proton antiporter [Gloeomargarita sp. SKYBB_i_bin120]